jgi:hypothetical protein
MHLWLQRIAIVANIGIDCEGELFKLVERKHNDGNPVVRQFDPIPVTDDEHFIWNSESWLDGDFYQIIKDCSISIANIAEFDFICEVMVTSPPQSIQDLMLLH